MSHEDGAGLSGRTKGDLQSGMELVGWERTIHRGIIGGPSSGDKQPAKRDVTPPTVAPTIRETTGLPPSYSFLYNSMLEYAVDL